MSQSVFVRHVSQSTDSQRSASRFSPLRLAPLAAFCLAFLQISAAAAAPGDLDSSFGEDGVVNPSIQARSVVVQSDGKIVVAGGGDEFKVSRLNPDGSLDPTFGDNGIVTTNFGTTTSRAFGVAIHPNGKIIAAGCASNAHCGLDGSYSEFAVARYHPDGSLDETFGAGGKVTTGLEFGSAIAYGVVVQSNGRIVLGGVSNAAHFALAGYRPDGSLDRTFGECVTDDCLVRTGFTIHEFPGYDSAIGLALASQRGVKMVLAGDVGDTYSGDIGVARYTAEGRLDKTFSADGMATMNTDSNYRAAEGVAIQPDGKPVAVGGTSAFGTTGDFAVGRFTAGGGHDGCLGTNGMTFTDFSETDRSRYDRATGVAIQSDGKIVVVGKSFGGRGGNYQNNTALVRYLPNGALDPSFGAGGKVLSTVGGEDVALQDDGKILVAGYGVARYLGGPVGGTDLAVTATSPSDGATGIAPATNISVTFSEPVDRQSAEAAFSLAKNDDLAHPVPGTFSWRCNTLTFDPTHPLSQGTDYTAKVGTGVTALSGASMPSQSAWRFRTLTTMSAAPSEATILAGTPNSSGGAAALRFDDNKFFRVSSTSASTRETSWYGAFTGVSRALRNLNITYKGSNSISCSQTISIWRWTTNSWVQLHTQNVGPVEVKIDRAPGGTLANYVSSTGGELRLRIRCTGTGASFQTNGDLLRIVYHSP